MNKRFLGLFEAFLLQGYSVIPLQDDKRPAIDSWVEFQERRATMREATLWADVQALGIVLGRISGLVAIDLDSAQRVAEFKTRFFDLYENTQRTITKRGEHIYFAIRANLPTTRGDNAEFRANGAYVVAPYSIIGEHTYKRAGKGQPLQITINQAQTLIDWVKSTGKPTEQHRETINTIPTGDSVHSLSINPLSAQEAIDIYYRYEYQGRNNALFAAAMACRDSGHSYAWTLAALSDVFISAGASTEHRRESQTSRINECSRTILSVYTRPPKKQQKHNDNHPGLSNASRELLNRLGKTRAALMLDCLRALGIKPGMQFSYTLIREIAREYLSDWTVREGIQDCIELGIIKKPPRTPVTPIQALPLADAKASKKYAICLAGQNQQKAPHREQTLYTMPSNHAVNRALGLSRAVASDEIPLADMTSPKAYREALNREFVRRRPGKHQPQFLAETRLGICERTLRRYNAHSGIKTEPLYHDLTITWANLDLLPDERVLGASFLLIEGKKYPLMKVIAKKALLKKKSVTRRTQTHNYYWYGSIAPLAVLNRSVLETIDYTDRETRFKPLPVPAVPAPEIVPAVPAESAAPIVPAVPAAQPPQPKPKRDRKENRAYRNESRKYKKPLSNDKREQLAHKLYEAVQEKAPNTLALTMCRRIAEICPIRRIERAIDLVGERDTIQSYGAFVTTVTGYALRVYHKQQIQKNQFS